MKKFHPNLSRLVPSMPEGAKSREYNRKSFTLIEMIVTISILVVIVGASMPALFVQKKRTKLDDATTQLKDAILSTQNFAFAPDAVDISDYVIAINRTSSSVDFDYDFSGGSVLSTIPARSFVIYSVSKKLSLLGYVSPSVGSKISSGTLPDTVFLNFTPAIDMINYRVSDKAAGFNLMYYNYSCPSGATDNCKTDWNNLWSGTDGNARIILTESGATRTIKINNTTGILSVES